MNNINYSVVIPHKNAPELLRRCLDSIPQRNDIEIIVVDNNSSEDIVDFECFPGYNRENVILIKDENSKGPGGARNTGLKQANGKWILFADADDYYLEGFIKVLDQYKESDNDVIYFNHSRKKENKDASFPHFLRNMGDDYEDILKYRLLAPWNKIVKRDFLVNKNILFEDSIYGEDIIYTFQIGYLSSHIYYIKEPLYRYIIHPNSISTKRVNNRDFYTCIFRHHYQIGKFYDFIGRPSWRRSLFVVFLSILKKNGLSQFLFAIKIFIKGYNQFRSSEDDYVNLVSSKL